MSLSELLGVVLVQILFRNTEHHVNSLLTSLRIHRLQRHLAFFLIEKINELYTVNETE